MLSFEKQSPKADSSFEESFNHPEILEFNDFPKGKVEVVDINPSDKKIETPLMVIPGWAATAEVHKENAKIFSENGRRTITISTPHGLETEKQQDLPLAELRKAAAITRIIEEKKLESVDVVTHSEGALFTTIAALQDPKKFRNIVFISPAGLIGEDNFWDLTKRFSSDIVQQWHDRKKSPERTSRINTALKECLKVLAKGPKKSIEEIKAIAEMQIQENLKELKHQGVGIVIVHPVGDKAFPMDRMQKMVKKEMVDGFVSAGDPKQTGEVADTHNAWYLTPQKYTKAVDSLLTSMEKLNNE
jgi:hypothetical protein